MVKRPFWNDNIFPLSTLAHKSRPKCYKKATSEIRYDTKFGMCVSKCVLIKMIKKTLIKHRMNVYCKSCYGFKICIGAV